MCGTRVVWPAIVRMPALSSAGAAQSTGSDGARFAQSPQYPLLPRALEIELALSAAPKHLRDDATVWVLDKSGYAIARKGGNAFACVVSRRAGDLFPVCWDAEGTRSLLPLDFEDAQLRLSGKSDSELEAIVTERFSTSTIRRFGRSCSSATARTSRAASTSTRRRRESSQGSARPPTRRRSMCSATPSRIDRSRSSS
jgi:hypothetical protein